MERKVKAARRKALSITGKPKRSVRWVNPTFLTESEQAAMYRAWYAEHQERNERATASGIKWRAANREKYLEGLRRWKLANKEK